ncbi:MAG: ATP-binding cassette domain-containing protein [Hymenobacter sp.]
MDFSAAEPRVLEPGTATAVLGPNGAGKSTLLTILAGQLLPYRGRGGVLAGRARALPPAAVPKLSGLLRALPGAARRLYPAGAAGLSHPPQAAAAGPHGGGAGGYHVLAQGAAPGSAHVFVGHEAAPQAGHGFVRGGPAAAAR